MHNANGRSRHACEFAQITLRSGWPAEREKHMTGSARLVMLGASSSRTRRSAPPPSRRPGREDRHMPIRSWRATPRPGNWALPCRRTTGGERRRKPDGAKRCNAAGARTPAGRSGVDGENHGRRVNGGARSCSVARLHARDDPANDVTTGFLVQFQVQQLARL